MLEKYVEVPRSMSLPKTRYNRSPYKSRDLDENGEEEEFVPQTEEEKEWVNQPLEIRGRFEYDFMEYEE